MIEQRVVGHVVGWQEPAGIRPVKFSSLAFQQTRLREKMHQFVHLCVVKSISKLESREGLRPYSQCLGVVESVDSQTNVFSINPHDGRRDFFVLKCHMCTRHQPGHRRRAGYGTLKSGQRDIGDPAVHGFSEMVVKRGDHESHLRCLVSGGSSERGARQVIPGIFRFQKNFAFVTGGREFLNHQLGRENILGGRISMNNKANGLARG